MKKRFIRNIVEIVLGGIMLFVSYSYVSMNDVEKTNFSSGLTIFSQKVQMRFDQVVGKGSSDAFQNQQNMIRAYDELIFYVSSGSCVSIESLEQLRNILEEMKKDTPDNYTKKEGYYNGYASNVYTSVQSCLEKKEK